MKKSAEHLLPEVWRALWGSPAIFVPPVAVFFLYILLMAGFFAVFIGSLAAGISNLGDLYSHFAYGDWRATVADFTIYTVIMLTVFAAVMLLIGLFHAAGWGNMFAAAATGRAGLGDYFGGVARFTVRIGVGVFLKHCIHAVPALFCAALWAVFMLLFPDSRGAVTLCFFLLLPPFIAVQALISFFLCMWRPACFIDDLGVVDAFGRSCRFVRENWLSLIVIFVLWFVSAILLNVSFVLLTSAGQLIFRELESVVGIPLELTLKTGAYFVSWALSFALNVFFTLYFYVFYHNRGVEAVEVETGSAPPWEIEPPGTAE